MPASVSVKNKVDTSAWVTVMGVGVIHMETVLLAVVVPLVWGCLVWATVLIARNKGRSRRKWGWFAVFFPLPTFIVVLAVDDLVHPATDQLGPHGQVPFDPHHTDL